MSAGFALKYHGAMSIEVPAHPNGSIYIFLPANSHCLTNGASIFCAVLDLLPISENGIGSLWNDHGDTICSLMLFVLSAFDTAVIFTLWSATSFI